jgi:hypothetical protein
VASRIVPPEVVARPTGAGVRRDPVVPARTGNPGPGAADPLPPRGDPVPATGSPIPAIGGLPPPPRGARHLRLRRDLGWPRSCPRRR